MQNRASELDEAFIRQQLRQPENSTELMWSAIYGYCVECGVKTDPKRLRRGSLNLFCLACEDAAVRSLLLSARFGS